MTFKNQTAFLVAARLHTTNMQLCRDCGWSLGRQVQNRTLLAGWWGMLSFFRNISYVASNAGELRRVRSMEDPTKFEATNTPLAAPLPPGRPLVARSGLWLTVGAIAASVVLMVTASANRAGSNDGPGTASEWRIGNCVAWDDESIRPVPCGDGAMGVIAGRAPAEPSCPANTESYVPDDGFVWCIDEDL